MTLICEGLRVVDFSTGMAGGIATVVLADNGADVIKVEPPAGDPARKLPAFKQWARGKKSVVLDLGTPAGQADARRLAASADVVVDNFAPGHMDAVGLGYDALAGLNPAIITCSITAFGQRGPYAAYPAHDALVQAKSGRMMDFEGELERSGPAFTAVPIADFSASQLAVQGIMAALYVRGRTGRGQRVNTSLVQGVACYDMFNWLSLQLYERYPEAFPRPYLQMGASYHYLVAATNDGQWVQFANAQARLFRAMVRCMDLEDVFEAAGVLGGGLLAGKQATEELWEILFLRLQEKTLDEWMETFLPDEDVSIEPFRTPREGMTHPQAIHNGNVVELKDPELGIMKQVGPLVRFADTPSVIGTPAPALGEHTAEVLAASMAPRPVTAGDSAVPRYALDGVTVLELAGFFAAPFGGSLLAELGARVIKVEPLEGDPMRPLQGATRTIQGKESIALDMKQPEARKVFYELVRKADVVFHNYRPGVPERLGMDYETLKAINPRLIYLYAASYGSTGPYSRRPAFHPTFGAICGGVIRQAGKGCPPPPGAELDYAAMRRISNRIARANEGNPDPNSALVVGTAITMALLARERTGQGQYLETTMLGSNAWANSDEFIDFAGAPPLEVPDSDLRGMGPLYRLYEAREGWIFLACRSQDEWGALVRALGRDQWLADPRFATEAARAANADTLIGLLGDLFQSRTAAEWETKLGPCGIGCVEASAGRYADFFVNDVHIREAGLAVEVEHPAWGKHMRNAPSVAFSLTPGFCGPGNRVGEHSRAILHELGYSADRIDALHEQNVVRSPA